MSSCTAKVTSAITQGHNLLGESRRKPKLKKPRSQIRLILFFLGICSMIAARAQMRILPVIGFWVLPCHTIDRLKVFLTKKTAQRSAWMMVKHCPRALFCGRILPDTSEKSSTHSNRCRYLQLHLARLIFFVCA